MFGPLLIVVYLEYIAGDFYFYDIEFIDEDQANLSFKDKVYPCSSRFMALKWLNNLLHFINLSDDDMFDAIDSVKTKRAWALDRIGSVRAAGSLAQLRLDGSFIDFND